MECFEDNLKKQKYSEVQLRTQTFDKEQLPSRRDFHIIVWLILQMQARNALAGSFVTTPLETFTNAESQSRASNIGA